MGIFAPSISSNAQSATVATSQTTTSTAYTDLATVGPSVTVTIGASGLALVSLYCSDIQGSVANVATWATVVVSGANTQAASDSYAIEYQAYGTATHIGMSATYLLTGLTAGSTTFKMQYRVNTGTGTWAGRQIAVVPL